MLSMNKTGIMLLDHKYNKLQINFTNIKKILFYKLSSDQKSNIRTFEIYDYDKVEREGEGSVSIVTIRKIS